MRDNSFFTFLKKRNLLLVAILILGTFPQKALSINNTLYNNIKNGNLATALSMISKDRIKNLSDYIFENGNTPLHIAAQYNNSLAIATFVRLNVNVNKKNDLGETPLFTAVKDNQEAALRTLLANGGNPSLKDDKGDFPLLRAVINQNYACASVLLKNGTNPNQEFSNHWTPLHFAALEGSDLLTLLLIHYNADVSIRAFYNPELTFVKNVNRIFGTQNIIGGWTPLHVAILSGSLKVVFSIYKKSYDSFNDVTKDGQFPIHLATLTHNLIMLRLLINLNIDINKPDINGDSPLILATKNNDVKIVKFLLNNRANPLLRNYAGVNARDIAKKIGYPTLIDLFNNYYHVAPTNPTQKPKKHATQAQLSQAQDIAYPKDSNTPPASVNNSPATDECDPNLLNDPNIDTSSPDDGIDEDENSPATITGRNTDPVANAPAPTPTPTPTPKVPDKETPQAPPREEVKVSQSPPKEQGENTVVDPYQEPIENYSVLAPPGKR